MQHCKELLIWHSTFLSLGQDGTVNNDNIATNILLIGSQDVLHVHVPITHTLNIVELIWPMLQNVSKTQPFTKNLYYKIQPYNFGY